MAHRWLRTKIETIAVHDTPGEVRLLRALRDDGQLFEAHREIEGTNLALLDRELRRKIDSMLEDPAMPPFVGEDGSTWSAQVPTCGYKDHEGWIEEPDGEQVA